MNSGLITKQAVRFLALAAFLLAGSARSAIAETFPERPIRIVIGFGQGGPTDVAARILADAMGEVLGQTVIVENKPGASGNIATQTTAEADADGYTLLVGALPLAVNHSRFPDFPVKFGEDIVALAAIGATNNVLVVDPDISVSSVAEFAALAESMPDEISCGTFGKGSSSHLGMVEFQNRANVTLLEVPYTKNSETVNDILGGHIKCWFAPVPSVAALVDAGELRALAVTGPDRLENMPDVPTFAELGYEGFDVRLWVGLFGRADIPSDRLTLLAETANAVLDRDDIRQDLVRLGLDPLNMDRVAFTAFVENEILRWAAIGETLQE